MIDNESPVVLVDRMPERPFNVVGLENARALELLVDHLIIHGYRRRGLDVPGEIALVGVDDFEWADAFEPRLAVVAQPCREIGHTAAALIKSHIADPSGPVRSVRLEPTLVIRDSCGCRAAPG